MSVVLCLTNRSPWCWKLAPWIHYPWNNAGGSDQWDYSGWIWEGSLPGMEKGRWRISWTVWPIRERDWVHSIRPQYLVRIGWRHYHLRQRFGFKKEVYPRQGIFDLPQIHTWSCLWLEHRSGLFWFLGQDGYCPVKTWINLVFPNLPFSAKHGLIRGYMNYHESALGGRESDLQPAHGGVDRRGEEPIHDRKGSEPSTVVVSFDWHHLARQVDDEWVDAGATHRDFQESISVASWWDHFVGLFPGTVTLSNEGTSDVPPTGFNVKKNFTLLFPTYINLKHILAWFQVTTWDDMETWKFKKAHGKAQWPMAGFGKQLTNIHRSPSEQKPLCKVYFFGNGI